MTYKQAKANLCIYFAWHDNSLVIFVAWVDEVMVLGSPSLVEWVQCDLEKTFTCNREGELTKYVGSNIMIHDSDGLGRSKFMQSVLVCKLVEEYKPTEQSASKRPDVASQVLMKGDGDGAVVEAQAKKYQSATATCMYMMRLLHVWTS